MLYEYRRFTQQVTKRAIEAFQIRGGVVVAWLVNNAIEICFGAESDRRAGSPHDWPDAKKQCASPFIHPSTRAPSSLLAHTDNKVKYDECFQT